GCGKQIDANVKFCRYCGFRYDGAPQNAAAHPMQQVTQTVKQQAGNLINQTVGGQAAGMLSQIPGAGALVQEVAASGTKGEESFDLGNLGMSNLIDQATGGALGSAMNTVGQVKGKITEILSPVKTILSGIRSFGGNLVGFIKNPKAAIPTILMGILWIVLGMMRDSDSSVVKALSFLTFSEGGLDRDAVGMVGGIFGKGVVAVAVTSLLGGGWRDVAAGCKTLFGGFKKNGDDKPSFFTLLIGVIIGVLSYFAFVGFQNASGLTAMAGISGILVSLEALGSKEGFLYKFVQSLTAKVQNGVRTAQNGKVASLFTGITAGFAIITALTALI
ncbi:MAG: zinc ribbon domain-containing protein, partial [Lachnospiraceae bacterium]|nr:zinc ribbon domain-containing protein [Lachnospiraceae bacterium]